MRWAGAAKYLKVKSGYHIWQLLHSSEYIFVAKVCDLKFYLFVYLYAKIRGIAYRHLLSS